MSRKLMDNEEVKIILAFYERSFTKLIWYL